MDCYYFVDSDQGGRTYMEDFICTNISHNSLLMGKSVYNHKLLSDVNDDNVTYFGIFDGHGGPEAARFAQCNLFSKITSEPGFSSDDDHVVMKAIETGFTSMNPLIKDAIGLWPKTSSGRQSTAGTTASIIIIRNNKMYIANVGDSTVVLGTSQPSVSLQEKYDCCIAETLTIDHKPCLDEEKQGIEHRGGAVESKAGIARVVWRRPKRGYDAQMCQILPYENVPFLAVSRSLGDLWSYNPVTDDYAVSSKPDVTVREIDAGQRSFVIMATDGLWNVMRPSEAVNIVHRKLTKLQQKNFYDADMAKLNRKSPATLLVQLAKQRWSRLKLAADNISVVVVMFESESASSPMSSDSGFLDTPTPNAVDSFHRCSDLLHASCGGLKRRQAADYLCTRTISSKRFCQNFPSTPLAAEQRAKSARIHRVILSEIVANGEEVVGENASLTPPKVNETKSDKKRDRSVLDNAICSNIWRVQLRSKSAFETGSDISCNVDSQFLSDSGLISFCPPVLNEKRAKC